jgi:hypothetical protein
MRCIFICSVESARAYPMSTSTAAAARKVRVIIFYDSGPIYSAANYWRFSSPSPLTFACQPAAGALSGDGDEGCARIAGRRLKLVFN